MRKIPEELVNKLVLEARIVLSGLNGNTIESINIPLDEVDMKPYEGRKKQVRENGYRTCRIDDGTQVDTILGPIFVTYIEAGEVVPLGGIEPVTMFKPEFTLLLSKPGDRLEKLREPFHERTGGSLKKSKGMKENSAVHNYFGPGGLE